MQFDIKYAYFNFLQSIDYQSPTNPTMPETLCEEIDSGLDGDDDTKWVLISQLVIFRKMCGIQANAEDQKNQGHMSKHNKNNVGKHYFPKQAVTSLPLIWFLPSADTILFRPSFVSISYDMYNINSTITIFPFWWECCYSSVGGNCPKRAKINIYIICPNSF